MTESKHLIMVALNCWISQMNCQFAAFKRIISYAEMLLLVRIMPFIIGDKIPSEDKHYNCFLLLLKILQIVMSPCIQGEIPPYLRVLIEEHHTMFIEIYPHASFIPKLHYMVHYPRQILEQGQLVRAWTMRYEGKLKHLKGISRSGNFKNITYTLAKRHQKWLVYHLYTRSMFTQDYTLGPIISTSAISEEKEDILSLIINNIDLPSNVTMVSNLKWVIINGKKYSNQNCYLVTAVSNGQPSVCKLERILLFHSNTIYFIMTECQITSYHEHFMAYTFSPTNKLQILSTQDITYPSPLHLRKTFFQTNSRDYLSLPFFVL